MDFDLSELAHIEQTFFDEGYADGLAHGRIHGLIEGRALGREKGFEIGEELGFYEGAGRVWVAAYIREGKVDHRAVHHARQLISLVEAFPRANPHAEEGIDLGGFLRQLRSRYKALCASVGVRPSLRAVLDDGVGESTLGDDEGSAERSKKKRSVWKVEGARSGEQGLSF